ncbi:hypothetical protein LRB11_15180 [Ectothiorhodospira haloalkaliphila]|uniref:hypothetical protein n=1 Tax=Ectothiorhodospira haloalkaliphila TaxID=421628 RepID=UPI001EE79301|nr:hypothetical protein [Ectothiorhodospira haloalkaliphila]MCG5526258.1 hypothetical protein [Ectothiorhodospira haloalkaliphila]
MADQVLKSTGYFFERLLGKPARGYDSILEIEQAVVDRYRKPLQMRPYDAAVIAEHGNVFPVAAIEENLDQAIDRELARMRG